jgi:hypothetical protein
MTRRYLLVVGSIILLFHAGGSFGLIETVDSGRVQFLVPPTPPQGAATADALGSLAGLAQFWTSRLGEVALRSKIKELLAESVLRAKPIIDWTGQGVLYEVRVVRNEIADREGYFNAQATAEYRGTGVVAEQALFRFLGLPQVLPGDLAGYKYAPEWSGFYFVHTDSKGTIAVSGVLDGTTNAMLRKMQSSYGDLQLQYAQANESDLESWIEICNNGKRSVTDAAAAGRLANLQAVLQDSDNRVRKIEADLKAAIEKSDKAEALARNIQILKLVLDAAALAKKAQTEIPEKAVGIKSDDPTEVVVQKITIYGDDNRRLAESLRVQVKTIREQAISTAHGIKPELRTSNAPPVVQRLLP